MITLKELKTKEELNNLYDNCSLTFEGFTTDKDNLDFLYEWLKNNKALKGEDLHLYLIKGKTMNEIYNLKRSNKYAKDLNIISVENDVLDFSKIVIKRFELGGRWFNDIVDNNERRN